MNSLSWSIYLASIVGGLAGTLVIIFIVTSLILIFWVISHKVSPNDCSTPSYGMLIPLIIIGFIGLLLPDKQTIYLIAGSEAGESVVTSEEGQEILNDIHLVIKQQLKSLKGD